MQSYNLHTHTVRCNHAEGTDREYVEAAIRSGMTVLGFADHCPQFFPVGDYYSHFRMRPELAEDYVTSVRRLQKEYASDIRILLGFEAEYYPATFDALMDFIRPLEPDYLIMGQHFVGNEYDEGSYYVAAEGKKEEYLDRYVRQVKEGLSTGAFTYLAHPDIVWYSGDPAYYVRRMGDLCRFAKERDIPMEYNLLGMLNRRCYPNPLFWDIVAATGCKTVVGYDAHTPKMLLSSGVYRAGAEALAARGVTPVPFDAIRLRSVQAALPSDKTLLR